jgi:hypothetical protein
MVITPRVEPIDTVPVGSYNETGDSMFLRFATRGNGVDLPAGVLRYAGNIRLGEKTIKVRKGSKALATDLELTNPPIILDFTLGVDQAVTSITRSGTTATVTTTAAHGLETGDYVAVEGADQADYNGDFEITVTGTDEFTYTVANSPATPATGTITVNHGPRIFDTYEDLVRGSMAVTNADKEDGFVLATTNKAFYCRAGEASVPIDYPAGETMMGPVSLEQFEGVVYLFRGGAGTAIAVSSITRSTTTATLTTATPHGLETGDWVYVEGGNENEYRGIVQVTVTDADTFTYTVADAGTTPATGDYTIKPCKPPLSWDMNTANDFIVASSGPNSVGGTTIKLPPTDWAIEFNRRLWLPYSKDQILGSDYSDANTIDTLAAELRIRPGGNDWLVAALGYARVKLLIAYRKSLHLATLGIGEELGPTSVERIPAAFGCAARETLRDCNGQILFLTDGGVARLRVTNELNLVADAIPLSDDIQDLFDRVNWDRASAAVAQFHDNRYYLALPLDDSTTNNTVFVYSFLAGGGWESVDTYPGDFDVQGLHTSNYEGRQRLHAVTSAGALYLLEELDVDEFGSEGEVTDNEIPAVAHTRYLRYGTTDIKRFRRALIELDLAAGDTIAIGASLLNPDRSVSLLSIAATEADDLTRRPHLGLRGAACSLEITTSAGRPEVKSYSIEANITDTSNKGF